MRAKKKAEKDMSLTVTERVAVSALLRLQAELQATGTKLDEDKAQVRAALERRLGLPIGALLTTHQINTDHWKVEAS